MLAWCSCGFGCFGLVVGVLLICWCFGVGVFGWYCSLCASGGFGVVLGVMPMDFSLLWGWYNISELCFGAFWVFGWVFLAYLAAFGCFWVMRVASGWCCLVVGGG